MGLYGWGAEGSSNYNIFMAVNNSALDDNGNGSSDYNRTFQGLVESKTSDGTANGLPLLRTKNSNTNASVDPHFDKDFLQGKNAFNTVLGKVYEDVSFPLKQKAVFAQNPDSPDDNDPESKAEYWYYDSSKSSLYLKQNQTDGKYYLESPKVVTATPPRTANHKTFRHQTTPMAPTAFSRLTKQSAQSGHPNTTTALAPSCNLTLRLQRTARLL